MPVTKEAVAKQVEEIEELLQGVLKGLSPEDQVRFLAKKGYYTSAISKVLKLNGPQIGEILKGSGAESKSKPKATETEAVPADPRDEETQKLVEKAEKNKKDKDAEAAAVIRGLKLPEARPIVEKEIEDSAWFHNVIHDVGNHVYHDIVAQVKLTDEELQNPGKAVSKIVGYFDALEALKEDASKLVDTQAESAELQYALKLTLKQIEKVKMFNGVLARSLCSECRMKALTTFVLSLGVLPTQEAGILSTREA